jgi:hypothetical protein
MDDYRQFRVPGKMVSKCTLRKLIALRIRFISMFIVRCIDTFETETRVYFALVLIEYYRFLSQQIVERTHADYLFLAITEKAKPLAYNLA